MDSDWGADPVPGLPPWGQHAKTGKRLHGYISWFQLKREVHDRGCGSQDGGGINPFMHMSSVYRDYVQATGA
jgi:hypothetical protein